MEKIILLISQDCCDGEMRCLKAAKYSLNAYDHFPQITFPNTAQMDTELLQGKQELPTSVQEKRFLTYDPLIYLGIH